MMSLMYSLLGALVLVPAFAATLVFLGRNNSYLTGSLPILIKKRKISQKDIPDQTGKVIIVTGANAGLGKASVKLLARKGATVIMGCRSRARAEGARKEILAELCGGNAKKKSTEARRLADNVIIMLLDLGSLSSVQQFALEFAQNYTRLDSLVLNAGVAHPSFGLTEDGIETQLGVNHVCSMRLLILLTFLCFRLDIFT